MRFTLVPSPLLGPASWGTVPATLAALGHEAAVATLDTIDDMTDTGLAAGSVLVPHSNAGYWAPSLAERTGAPAVVYVDAALPAYDVAETPLAPPDLRELLDALPGDDGLLPPWTQWWDDVDELFPDDATRRAVEAEQPRLPVTWFDQRVPVPAHWQERPSAYLGLGTTYADEQRRAVDAGWPLRRLDGAHLHQLHDPVGVATAVAELARRVTGEAAGRSATLDR